MGIILVRHGETAGNRERVMQVAGIPLSELGQRQAELLAVRLHALGVARILCSDLQRAQMTAAPLAAASGLAVELSPLLRERDFGDLRGIAYSALGCDPFAADFVPPRGESWELFHARVADAFATICGAQRETKGNLVVITHGLVARAILQRHVSWPAHRDAPPALDNTSVTLLAGEVPYAPTLVNCCAHLQAQVQSPPQGGAA